MKIPNLRDKLSRNYPLLAFCVPTGLILVLMFITSTTPFGKYTMLYSDNYHQYFPFFKAFRQALLSGDSLLWNWSVGMGMDYLGLVSYYLASPLNLLSVLVPEGFVLSYFTLLVPIKLGFAGFSFAYMLKKLYGKNDWSIVLFGSFYGMCAWGLGYQWNVMWLDSFALLPLVVLGTVELLRDKKYKLYTLSLFFAVASNYYVGFFVCIFVLLLFFCYQICRCRSVLRLLADFCRIGFFTVLALGMTLFLELPALAALQTTYSSVNNFPEGFRMNLVTGEALDAAKTAWEVFKTAKEAGTETFALWWDAMRASFPPILEGMGMVAGQMGGGQTPTYIDGLPNLYCGVFAVALGTLFFFARQIRIRDKLCCLGLLLLFVMSILIRQLDYIWHGFHFTNQIPYRFSFLFSFVLLYMAYRAWLHRESFQLWQILAAGVLSLALLLVSPEKREDPMYLAFNLAFWGFYMIAMLYGNPKFLPDPTPVLEAEASEEAPEPEAAMEPEAPAEPETPEAAKIRQNMAWARFMPTPAARNRHCAIALLCIIGLELFLNLVSFGTSFGSYNYDYPKNWENVSSMLQVMRDQENDEDLFYRTEMTHSQTLNDGALNGYYGISTFTSSANVAVTEFIKDLGFGAWNTYNRYCYEESSPVANLFLNLKYMIQREGTPGENSYFDVLHSYDNVTLMENNAFLPLGFMTQEAILDVNFEETSRFNLQNQLFSYATGIDEKVWTYVKDSDVQVVTENVTMKTSNLGGYSSFSTGETGGKLMYHYNVTQEGFMCIDLNLYKQKNYSIWHNGIQLYRDSYSLPQIVAVCDVKPGDNVQVVVECGANFESTSISIRAAVLNEERFRQGYDILKKSTLELTDFSNTYLKGNIVCDRDGLLYTSIPQDGNWLAYVDGKPVETTLVGGAMLALPLTVGSHTVEFRYENKAFLWGLRISLCCAAVFGGVCLGEYLYKRRKKNKEQGA